MKTRKPSAAQISLPLASAIASLLATLAAQATDFFWDGANGNWATASDWSTTDAGTSNPAAIPNSITTADLFFNISSKNAASSFISSGGGSRNALSLTFNSSGATNMRAGSNSSAASTLTIGAGGITLAASSGNVTLGQTPSSFGTLNVALGADQTWTNNATSTLTVTGAITGASRQLTKSGTGKILLTGSNGYSGNTTVSGGVLQLGSANALPGGIASAGGTSLLILNGGVIGLGDGNFSRTMGSTAANFQFLLGGGGFAAYGGDRTVTTGTLSFGSTVGTNIVGTLKLSAADSDSTTTWTSNISFGGSARTVEIANGSAAIDAKLSGQLSGGGSSGMNKTGSGTLALTSNANSYTGDTTVTLGTLMLGDGTANTGKLGSTAAISLATGATLAVNRTGATTQATDLNGKIISGAGGFSQVGSGTTTLSLANTYTGATAVNAGTLIVDGNQSAADGTVTVAAGTANATTVAKLGGNGTIGGNVILTAESSAGFRNGGVLAPTAAPSGVAKLTVAGTTTFNTGSLFEWNMSAITPEVNPGVEENSGSYGQLSATASVGGSNAVFNIVLGAGNSFSDAFWNSDKSWSNIFTGAGAPGSLTSIFSSIAGAGLTWDGDNNRASFGTITPGGDGGYFTTTGATLNWTAVPEPSSALGGLLVGAGLLRRRRSA